MTPNQFSRYEALDVLLYTFSISLSKSYYLDVILNPIYFSIIHWIRMFCNLEYESHRLGFMERFSPLLEASFLGFITRFSSSYIMYNEDMYSEVCGIFVIFIL